MSASPVSAAPLSWTRLLPVLLLIGVTALVIEARERPEVLPPHQDLSAFPLQIGDWSGVRLSLPADELAVLGPGEFSLRNYRRLASEPPANLFLAYFPSQRTGDTIHSPKNCLPGSGWTPDESGRIAIPVTASASIVVNRYIVSKGLARDLVLYWYQAHGRVTPSEYWAKVFLVSDAMRMNRTDGALVRIVTEIPTGTDPSIAQTRATQFAQQIFPLLSTYVPR